MTREAYIGVALRTPVGKHGGSLANVRPDDLAAIPIKAVVERSGVPLGVATDAANVPETVVGPAAVAAIPAGVRLRIVSSRASMCVLISS